jgi:hypothetical protein
MNKKEILFRGILDEISDQQKNKSMINFERDKQKWICQLKEMFNNIILNEYVVDSVDDLVLNLGPFSVGYDESFIKYFEILYKESFADIPRELWIKCKPYTEYLRLLNIESVSNYKTNLIRYFKNVYNDTLKSMLEMSTEILNVEITNFMFEYLADITINMFINLAENLATIQTTSFTFGKSTRIQFFQIFNAFLNCSPRLKKFTQAQKNTIHYFLLTNKVLQESNQIFESENVE